MASVPYFYRIMCAYPTKIFLIGLMGSGKSYWGRHLAIHFRYPFLDLDKGIEIAEQKTISEIFEGSGEAYFRKVEMETLRRQHADYAKFVMSCGGGTPCFYNNMDWMKQNGTVVWLNPSVEVLAGRLLAGKEKRPLIKNATCETDIIETLERLMASRLSFYNQSDLIITEPFPTIQTFENILKHA